MAVLIAGAIASVILVAPQTASAAGPTLVSGIVTAADSGAPLADVDVFIGDGEIYGDSTTTGSDGRYTLPDVPQGTFDVIFIPSTLDYVDEYNEGSPNYRDSTPVTFTGGSRTINATLERAAAISTTASNVPPGELGSTAYRFDDTLNSWVPSGFGYQNEAGFGGLPAGTFKVGFDSYSSGPASYVGPEFVGGATRPETSQNVSLVAGQSTPIPAVQFDTFSFPGTDRVQGATRFDVAVNISQAAFLGTAPVVYIATGLNYPDALAAGPIAAEQGGPLLLTTPQSLPAAVASEITRLQPSRIVVVGGPNSVGPAVLNELESLRPDATVTRVTGADRYEAGRNLVASAFPGQVPLLYITTGQNFPDALSAGAAAGHYGVPVLLVNGQGAFLDTATQALITRLNPKEIRVAGGPNSVSSTLYAQLLNYAPTLRVFGQDRFAASEVISSDGFVTADRVFLATGFNFPDALAGSAWAGKLDAPLFTVPGNCVPDQTKRAIAKLGPTQITLLGGPSSVSTTVQSLTVCP